MVFASIGFAVTASIGAGAISGAVAAGAAVGITSSFAVFSIIGVLVVAAVIGVLGLLLGPLLGGLDAGSGDNTANRARVPTDPNNKNNVAYGHAVTAGSFIFVDNSEDETRLAAVCVLSHGDIEGVESIQWDGKEVYFNTTDNLLPALSIENVAKNAVGPDGEDDGFLNDNLKVRVYPDAGSRNTAMEQFSPQWNADASRRKMGGLAHLYCEIEFDSKEQIHQLTPKLFARIKGLKIRTFNTSGILSSENAKVFSNNPAEVFLDFMTNTVYGCSIPFSQIDLPSFYSHAKFCDESIQYMAKIRNWTNGVTFSIGEKSNYEFKTYTSKRNGNTSKPSGATDDNWTLETTAITEITGTAARYTTNGSINMSDKQGKIWDYLTRGNQGLLSYNGGKYSLNTLRDNLVKGGSFVVGRTYVIKTVGTTDYTAIGANANAIGEEFFATGVGSGNGTADELAAVLSEDDFIGGIEFSCTELNEATNRGIFKYRSREHYDQINQVIIDIRDTSSPYYSPTLLNPNEPLNQKELTFPLTNNQIETERNGALIVNQARQDLQGKVTVPNKFFYLQAGDNVGIRHTTPGYGYEADLVTKTTPKIFRIHKIEERLKNNFPTLTLDLVEYLSDTYTSDRMIIERDLAPGSNFKSASLPADIGSTTIRAKKQRYFVTRAVTSMTSFVMRVAPESGSSVDTTITIPSISSDDMVVFSKLFSTLPSNSLVSSVSVNHSLSTSTTGVLDVTFTASAGDATMTRHSGGTIEVSEAPTALIEYDNASIQATVQNSSNNSLDKLVNGVPQSVISVSYKDTDRFLKEVQIRWVNSTSNASDLFSMLTLDEKRTAGYATSNDESPFQIEGLDPSSTYQVEIRSVSRIGVEGPWHRLGQATQEFIPNASLRIIHEFEAVNSSGVVIADSYTPAPPHFIDDTEYMDSADTIRKYRLRVELLKSGTVSSISTNNIKWYEDGTLRAADSGTGKTTLRVLPSEVPNGSFETFKVDVEGVT